MKKVILFVSTITYCLTVIAQEKITREQARSICAQEMATFTKIVSGAYQRGYSYDQFQIALCGNLQPATEGINQLKAAYIFLVQGATNDFIIKNYNGREVAASLNYLSNAHNKGIESDGSELFGGKTGTSNSALAKNADGGCKWYQVWCLMQTVATWLVMNWPPLQEIINLLNGPLIIN